MFVTYKDGVETGRSMAHQTILAQSEPAVIEQGTQIPPTYVKPLSGGRFTSGFGKTLGQNAQRCGLGMPDRNDGLRFQ